jgi:hypothetical protein
MRNILVSGSCAATPAQVRPWPVAEPAAGGIFSPLTSQPRPVGPLTPVAATPQIASGSAIAVAGGRDRRLERDINAVDPPRMRLVTSNPTNRFADHHQSSALSRRSLIPSVEITMRVDLHEIHRIRSSDELLAATGAA